MYNEIYQTQVDNTERCVLISLCFQSNKLMNTRNSMNGQCAGYLYLSEILKTEYLVDILCVRGTYNFLIDFSSFDKILVHLKLQTFRDSSVQYEALQNLIKIE